MIQLILLSLMVGCTLTEVSLSKCGKSSGCFRVPETCKSEADCQLMLIYTNISTDEIQITMFGKTSGWTAFGLTEKTKQMDGIHGEICMLSNIGPTLKGFVTKGTHIHLMPLKAKLLESTYKNGAVMCRYTRNVSAVGYMRDATQKYHIIASWGKMEKEDNEEEPEEHEPGHYFWSKDMISLVVPVNVEVESFQWKTIVTHGLLMAVGWLLLASSGMFTARYGKSFLGHVEVFSSKIWFQLHRSFMVLCLLCTIAGLIIIFSQKNTDVQDEMRTHKSVGITVVVFACLNVIAGFFRPSKEHKYRYIFNWLHRVCGLLVLTMAVFCMTTGFAALHVTSLPMFVSVVMTIFIVIGLEIMKLIAQRSVTEQPFVSFGNKETHGSVTISNEPEPSTGDVKYVASKDDLNKKIEIAANVSMVVVICVNALACTLIIVLLTSKAKELSEFL